MLIFSGNMSIFVFSTFHFYEVCIVWIRCFRFSAVIKIVRRFRSQLLMLFHLMRCTQCSLVVAADVFDAICDDCKYIFGFVYWCPSRVWLIKPKNTHAYVAIYCAWFRNVFFSSFIFHQQLLNFYGLSSYIDQIERAHKYFTPNSYRCEK